MSHTFFSRILAVCAATCLVAAGAALGGVVRPDSTSALPGPSESTIVTIEPARILDTRFNIGLNGPMKAGTNRTLRVTGKVPTFIEATSAIVNKTVVPAGATGVVLNITAVLPTAEGFLSVRPGDVGGVPATAGLNFRPGDIVPNALTVALPTNGSNKGRIGFFYGAAVPGATVHVVADVVGYTTAAGLTDLSNRLVALEAAVEGAPTVRYAKVDADTGSAALLHQVGATAAGSVATGVFSVTFDASVVGCGWIASRNDNLDGVSAPGEISVELGSATDPATLWVRTFNSAGTATDPSDSDGFTLQVIC